MDNRIDKTQEVVGDNPLLGKTLDACKEGNFRLAVLLFMTIPYCQRALMYTWRQGADLNGFFATDDSLYPYADQLKPFLLDFIEKVLASEVAALSIGLECKKV